jgi:O-antigen/teichoic acid export membrane protein
MLPIGLVTYYVIAASLTEYARQLVSAISVVVSPWASSLQATRGDSEAAAAILRIGAAATVVTVPIAMTFVLRGESFISLWMGPEYAPRATPVLTVLAVVVWLYGGRATAAAGLMGLNRHRGLAAAVGAEAAANLGLSIALIGPLGLRGVALGTTIPSVVVTVGFLPWYFRRHLGVSVRRFVTRIWLIPSCACLAFGIATYGMERWLGAESLLAYFAQVAVLLPLVALGAGWLVFSKDEWTQFRDLLAPMSRILTPRSLPDGKSRSRD